MSETRPEAEAPSEMRPEDRPKVTLPEGDPTAAPPAEAPSDAAPGGDPAEAVSDAERIAELEADLAEMRDRWMRALAEAENARKRAAKDRQDSEKFGGKRIARDLLAVYDNLQRALDNAPEGGEAVTAFVEGVELTQKELMAVFARHGVTVVVPEVGDAFDPDLHEAMFEAPVPGTKKGEIIQVSAAGFLLYDRLLRPAQVGVSSMPTS